LILIVGTRDFEPLTSLPVRCLPVPLARQTGTQAGTVSIRFGTSIKGLQIPTNQDLTRLSEKSSFSMLWKQDYNYPPFPKGGKQPPLSHFDKGEHESVFLDSSDFYYDFMTVMI